MNVIELNALYTESLVGKTYKEASKIIAKDERTSRITRRGNNYYIVTRDYVVDRINLELSDAEIVEKIHVG